jgi:hypothetical protein
MIRESDLELVRGWTKKHAEYCSKIWSVDFDLENYSSEVHTFYVRDLQIPGREELHFRHLFELEEKIQTEFGNRYRVGIIYEQIPPE